MIRVIILTLSYMLLCQGLYASTPMRSVFDANQFLSLASQSILRFQNTHDQPITLSIIMSTTHTLQPGQKETFIAPDLKELIFWRTTETSGFPKICGKGKTTHISNYKFKPSNVDTSYEEIFTVQPRSEQRIEAPDRYAIKFITVNHHPNIYANIENFTETKIILMTTPQLAWSAARRPHNFKEEPYQYYDPIESTPSDFRDIVLPKTCIDSKNFYQKIQDSYDRNLFDIQNCKLPESQTPCIPKEINIIWLTDRDFPHYPNQQFHTFLLETMKVCPPQTTPEYGLEGGFTYTLWVNPIESLPFLKLQPLAGLDVDLERYITVRDITTINIPSCVNMVLQTALQAKNYGESSDILRCLILRNGGFYIDTDYVFKRSPWRLCYSLDFFSGIEGPHACAACNAMIAVSLNHPIIQKCLDLISQYSDSHFPGYITQQKYRESHIQTLFRTGPFMFSLAYYLACGTRDTLFPANVFFPSLNHTTIFGHDRLGEHHHTMSWFKK